MERRTQITVVAVQCFIILLGLVLFGAFMRLHSESIRQLGHDPRVWDPVWIPGGVRAFRWMGLLMFALPLGWILLVHKEARASGGLHNVPGWLIKLGIALTILVFLICAWEVKEAMRICFGPWPQV